MARIGVNALYLIPGHVGGTEIYLRELLAALAAVDSINQYFIFTNLETAGDLAPRQANFHLRPQAIHGSFRPGRILWEQIVLPLEAARYRIEVLFNPGFTALAFAPCPQVTVFHDLQHKRHPEHFRWFDLPFWRLLLWVAVHRSARLISVSEATRKDILAVYRIAAEQVVAIQHGVDLRFFSLDRSKSEPYILCVSTLHPHKNIERLVRAYARSARDRHLVLAGMRGFQTQAIQTLIAELGVEKLVTITGWIPREELVELYARADGFVYPSTFEGFGLPVLEALAAGIPTACSDIPPLREVAGDAALYFDPLDDAEVAKALRRITSDEALRKKLAAAGPERARPFTWRRSAEETLAVLLNAAGSTSHG